MKISKILAGMSAAALAASMMSLAAFADETATVKADLTGGTVSLIDEKDDDGVVTKTGVLTGTNVKLADVCGIDINVTVGADSAAKIEAGGPAVKPPKLPWATLSQLVGLQKSGHSRMVLRT